MPSLERFFDPQMRKFDANVRPLPGARLYFFENGTTTPKTTYKDKQGSIGHDNPVIADSTGVFPQIFLDGLYRVELRSSSNIVQPGWPIDNIGQDTPVVPFGPWVEINTYNEGEVVTGSNGNWYRSITDNNLGNDPISSPSEWEVIPIPVASSFTSNKDYLTWADDGDQVSLNVDTEGLIDEIAENLDEIDGNLAVGENLTVTGTVSSRSFMIASRSTNKQITSSTTYEQDADLTLSNLEPSTRYKIDAYIAWSSGNTDSNGIKLRLNGNIASSNGRHLSFIANTAQISDVGGESTLLIVVDAAIGFEKMPEASFSLQAIKIEGFILTTSTTGPRTIYVDWAQLASSVIPTTVLAGSFISATKL